jgi:DNA adenine methylase
MIKPPYPYFGGKMAVRDLIWQRLGYTPNRVDPFFGGGSFLWFDPGFDWQTGDWRDDRPRIETVNDIDGFVANFWRAVRCAPAEVAARGDRPGNEKYLNPIP